MPQSPAVHLPPDKKATNHKRSAHPEFLRSSLNQPSTEIPSFFPVFHPLQSRPQNTGSYEHPAPAAALRRYRSLNPSASVPLNGYSVSHIPYSFASPAVKMCRMKGIMRIHFIKCYVIPKLQLHVYDLHVRLPGLYPHTYSLFGLPYDTLLHQMLYIPLSWYALF